MRIPLLTVMLRILLMLLALSGWFSGAFWLVADTSITNYPLLLCLIMVLSLLPILFVLPASQWWIQLKFCPQKIEHASHERFAFVARIVRHQATLLKLPTPSLYVYDSDTLNAFIVGGLWRQQHLYLSDALLTQLSHDDIEAVIAHELAHIYYQDSVVNEVFFALSLTCMLFVEYTLGKAMAWFVNKEDRAEMAKQIAIIMTYGGLLLPLWLMMLLYSRRSEYRADALASHLVGRQQFIHLLHRLKDICHDHFFNLDGPQVLLRHYFVSHPPLHHRINAIEARQQA